MDNQIIIIISTFSFEKHKVRYVSTDSKNDNKKIDFDYHGEEMNTAEKLMKSCRKRQTS